MSAQLSRLASSIGAKRSLSADALADCLLSLFSLRCRLVPRFVSFALEVGAHAAVFVDEIDVVDDVSSNGVVVVDDDDDDDCGSGVLYSVSFAMSRSDSL